MVTASRGVYGRGRGLTVNVGLRGVRKTDCLDCIWEAVFLFIVQGTTFPGSLFRDFYDISFNAIS